MYYDSLDIWWWPYLFIFLAGALPTAVWRWIGVLAIGNVDENAPVLTLVRCVATALVAAVIAQFVFFPGGALALLPLWIRAGAAIGGFCAFLFAGRRLFVCILAGEALLLTGWLAMVG